MKSSICDFELMSKTDLFTTITNSKKYSNIIIHMLSFSILKILSALVNPTCTYKYQSSFCQHFFYQTY